MRTVEHWFDRSEPPGSLLEHWWDRRTTRNAPEGGVGSPKYWQWQVGNCDRELKRIADLRERCVRTVAKAEKEGGDHALVPKATTDTTESKSTDTTVRPSRSTETVAPGVTVLEPPVSGFAAAAGGKGRSLPKGP